MNFGTAMRYGIMQVARDPKRFGAIRRPIAFSLMSPLMGRMLEEYALRRR